MTMGDVFGWTLTGCGCAAVIGITLGFCRACWEGFK